MPVIDFHKKEINFKVVYYGPGLSGKTTNIQYIHEQIKPKFKGKLVSLATQTDRTLFFDFLPVELGEMGGYKIRMHLYTVPGQVHYNATRKLVLKGVDGIIFVADSQLSMKDANIESILNLEKNLQSYGRELKSIPRLIQCNKRDLENLMSMETMKSLISRYGAPMKEAVATEGTGVLETLKEIVKLVIRNSRDELRENMEDVQAEETGGEMAGMAGEAPDPPHDPMIPVESAEDPSFDTASRVEPVMVLPEEAEDESFAEEVSQDQAQTPERNDEADGRRSTEGAILDLDVPLPDGGKLRLKLGLVARVLQSSRSGEGADGEQKVELYVKPIQAQVEGLAPVLPPESEPASGTVEPPAPEKIPVEELLEPIEEPAPLYDPTFHELDIEETPDQEGPESELVKKREKGQKRGLLGLFKKGK